MHFLLFGALFLLSEHAQTSEWNDSQVADKLFGATGVKDTFTLYDAWQQRYVDHDRKRVETCLVSASTYKMTNNLIDPSTGAVRSADEVPPYGGEPQHFKAWEHDMNLHDVTKTLDVPVYQELTQRAGLERVRVNVSRLGHGNVEISQAMGDFQLVGSLRISTVEQTRLLLRLTQEGLPFPAPVRSIVCVMTLLESNPGWELHGRTS